jgi:hypothetical protein
MAKVVPQNIPGNYIPISVLLAISKIMEHANSI